MHIPTFPPYLVGGLLTAGNGDARVGAVDVQPSPDINGALHQLADVRLARDVGGSGNPAHLLGDGSGRGLVDVGDDHHLCAGARKGAAQRSTDPTPTTGDDDHATGCFHALGTLHTASASLASVDRDHAADDAGGSFLVLDGR